MTTLKPLTDPGVLISLGGQWTLVVKTRDSSGNVSSAVTPVLLLTLPDGTTAAPAFEPWLPEVFGHWIVTYTTVQAGRHLAHVSTPEDALDLAAYVAGPTSSTDFPDVNDVALYLKGAAASWSTDQLQAELDSETSAQRGKCGVRAVYPPDLRQALLRRVQRALAFRALPLATLQGDADGGAVILPGNDPEVRRLEAPYRKLTCG